MLELGHPCHELARTVMTLAQSEKTQKLRGKENAVISQEDILSDYKQYFSETKASIVRRHPAKIPVHCLFSWALFLPQKWLFDIGNCFRNSHMKQKVKQSKHCLPSCYMKPCHDALSAKSISPNRKVQDWSTLCSSNAGILTGFLFKAVSCQSLIYGDLILKLL